MIKQPIKLLQITFLTISAYHMTCQPDTLTRGEKWNAPNIYRCENKEVVCYTYQTGGGIQCFEK